MSYATARSRSAQSERNKLYVEDRAIHEWYRFVLAFPPHLVRDYLERFGADEHHYVLDPFCGTGTVLVECKKLGVPSVGVEANPIVVFSSSNLHFGPEVGVGRPQPGAPVVAPWLECIHAMASDLRASAIREHIATPATALLGDARQIPDALEPYSIDTVITSPPYPNEKDYTQTTRLESVLLGFLKNKADLRALKQGLLRSNTRTVYKGDDDDAWVADHVEIQRIADEIEARRITLNKTSGFERQYAKVTRQYFGGMARHLSELRPFLRPGAQLAYVVGDQASFLRVMIPTGQLLADIARTLGYEVTGLDLWRTRLATATKAQLREEVVVLRWPG